MITRVALPRGFLLDRKSGLALPNDPRALISVSSPSPHIMRMGSPIPAARVGAEVGGGVPDDMVLAINWNTGTGTSTAAVLDTDKARPLFVLGGVIDGRASVVANTGGDARAGFPTPNYLRFSPSGSQPTTFFEIGYSIAQGNYVPAWNVGDGWLSRYYIRNSFPYSEEDPTPGTHGDEWQAAYSGVYSVGYHHPAAFPTKWQVEINAAAGPWEGTLGNPGLGYAASREASSCQPVLTKGADYRVQTGVKRIATNEARLYCQIYEEPSGTRLYTHSDFTCECFSSEENRTLASETFINLNSLHWSTWLREWWMGCEGIDATPDGSIVFEWAGMAQRFGPNIDFDASWPFHTDELEWGP